MNKIKPQFTRIPSAKIAPQFTPLCPNCNKRMEIHKSMSGYQWYCPDYWKCGGRIKVVGETVTDGVRGRK